MKYVVFDFNGTILDDVKVGLKAENVCIKKFLKRPPMELDEYLHSFTFSVSGLCTARRTLSTRRIATSTGTNRNRIVNAVIIR